MAGDSLCIRSTYARKSVDKDASESMLHHKEDGYLQGGCCKVSYRYDHNSASVGTLSSNYSVDSIVEQEIHNPQSRNGRMGDASLSIVYMAMSNAVCFELYSNLSTILHISQCIGVHRAACFHTVQCNEDELPKLNDHIQLSSNDRMEVILLSLFCNAVDEFNINGINADKGVHRDDFVGNFDYIGHGDLVL